MQAIEQIVNNLNINGYNNIKEIINSFSSDFNIIKDFIKFLKDLINKSLSGNKNSILMLNNINTNLPLIIEELAIPFCDLIIKDNEILNFYINNFLNNKSKIFKNIIINLINIFNFKSIEVNPSSILIQMLQNYDPDIKQLTNNKRINKTEIEEIYDNLNAIEIKVNNENEQDKDANKFQVSLKEIKDKINEAEKKKKYSNSIIDFLKEKTNMIEEYVNNKQIIFNKTKVNYLNINTPYNINYMNFLNNFYFFNQLYNLNKTNNINIQNNNGLTTNELNKLKEIPLKDRTFLYKDEELSEGENEYIEFKNYTYPFSQEKIDEIKRQYCGFLNCQGGRIYLGINDLKIVKGIHLDYKMRDTIRNELINYTYDFYPKCRLNKINIYFIPIKSMINKKIITNLYVVNIIILPGEPYNLYSLTNKGGYISALRLPGQCINLTAEEIHSEIMRRAELLKEKYIQDNNNHINTNEEKEVNENEENEEITNENTTEEDMNEDVEDNNESDDKKSNGKIVYVVKIKNIDTSLKIKDINRFFNGCGSSFQKFPAKDGKSEGQGEIHFSKKETAKSLIKKYNKMSLCGKQKIIMTLKKRKVYN